MSATAETLPPLVEPKLVPRIRNDQLELALKFLGPGDVQVPEVRMDVRTGGSYSIVMLMPDGERMNVGGTYRDVRPPERLAMTGAGKKTNRKTSSIRC